MRRKLKAFKAKHDKGEMSMQDINHAYQSWLGYAAKKDTYKTRKSMQLLFNKLFGGCEKWAII